jgi:hypothetical protein
MSISPTAEVAYVAAAASKIAADKAAVVSSTVTTAATKPAQHSLFRCAVYNVTLHRDPEQMLPT